MTMTVNRPLFQVLLILKCELFCLVQSQTLQISSKFMSGNVIFTWTPATYPAYDVQFTTGITNNTLTTVYDAQFTVKDAMLYDFITINVKRPGPANDNRVTYNVSKVKSQIGDTKNTSWITATLSPVFAFFGQYQVYHTYRKKRTILSVSSSGVRYDGKTTSPKYTLLAGPFDSTNVTFEITDITMDDAGYYHGGLNDEAAWSGGGVVLIVSGKPLKPNITGNINIEVNKYITLTCSSNSTSAPDYYSKLVTLSYTWFVNDTKINIETRETLRREVTRDLKYNRYSCTATEDLESKMSDQVQINPLYISDKLSISPQLTLNYDNKLEVKGDTVGPFNCSADCNPACDITWVLRISGRVMDASAKDGMLLPLVVNRTMELVQCETEWKHNNETVKQGIGLDVQYLENPILYVNDILHSKGDVNENMTLKISCHVDGNPDPTIRLSRGQADTVFLERQGAWLNHTITKAQCTDTDTYTCRGTSTGFNNTETEFNINVFCKTRFDYSRSFEYIYGSKSGVGVKVNAAVSIIANPPPQISDFTWEGPVPVSLRTTILRGATIYTHVIETAVPVKDPNYFGNYTLKYKGQTITEITIKSEDVPQAPLNFMVYSYASGLVNLTWVSGFNGGLQQFFILTVNEGST